MEPKSIQVSGLMKCGSLPAIVLSIAGKILRFPSVWYDDGAMAGGRSCVHACSCGAISMKLFLAISTLAVGLVIAWCYLVDPALTAQPTSSMRDHELLLNRPWRKLGAAIVLVVAVMFTLGLYVLDLKGGPVVFVAYWLTVLVLIVWLCILAIRDVLYTRRIVKLASGSVAKPEDDVR